MAEKINSSEVTPESVFLNRRNFLRTSIFVGTTLATGASYRYYSNSLDRKNADVDGLAEPPLVAGPNGEMSSSFEAITHYNNFYEFTTDKSGVAGKAKDWKPAPWKLVVDGLVEKSQTFNMEDLLKLEIEERIYRFRCVEGWSMVIPWQGFSLAHLLKKVEPQSAAKYVAFTSYYDGNEMQSPVSAGIDFPYVEGLRLDEAMHPLTIMATGIYGNPLLNQNGAPVRLVVPWKYGFKSIKSVVKISLTDKIPPTTWNLANPNEYGFYSNVNPQVDHPRWSQAQERRIGDVNLRKTFMFNGYEDEVSSLYAGMNLRENF